MQKKTKINDIPSNKIVIKPWGSEYKIYNNSILSIKLLKINQKHGTSLHCHPIKKTGFILIKGNVEVDLGFYNKKKISPISRLMIRPGLFHSTKNIGNTDSIILEIETPIDKDDLVRFKDGYGRVNKLYEGKNFLQDLTKDNIIFKEPKMNEIKNYKLENVLIDIKKTNKIANLRNEEKDKIYAILDGGLKSEKNLSVLSPGDIVGSDTIEKLSEVFIIDKYISYLKI